MILILASTLIASTEPNGLDLNQVVKPYVTCLSKQRDRLVSRINSEGRLAATDAQAVEMAAQLKLKIKARALELCARDRALAKKEALRALERAYRHKSISFDPAYIESLLTYSDELDFPFIIPVANPIH
jgi:hypothetical protein